MAILDDNISLGILALLAKDKFVDEAVEVVLQLGRLMGTVDDPAVILGVHVGLSTEFEPEVLDDVGTGACERSGNAREIDNDCLDAISLPLNLGLKTLHLVAIEDVADI